MSVGTRRRQVLASGAAALATASATALWVNPTFAANAALRMKGPEVWMGMDQAELDAAYDQFKYAPNGPQIVRRYAINSESNRRRLGAPQRHAYGSTLIEGLVLYRADKSGGRAPVNIFVHGGAWRTGLAKDYAFAAEMFVNAGVHLVVPDFVWVQDADGDLRVMASQLQRAVAWVYRNAPGFGGDSNRIFMSGHSSGAHLTSVLMTTPWQKSFNLPENPIKGAVLAAVRPQHAGIGAASS